MTLDHWKRILKERAQRAAECETIDAIIRDRDALVGALRCFARAYEELPEDLRRQTEAMVRDPYYGITKTEVVVRFGNAKILAGHLQRAHELVRQHTNAT